MASGTQQQQQQRQQAQQEHLMQHQQQQHNQQQQNQQQQQMQFAPNLTTGLVSPTNFDLHQQQMHQNSTMSPSAALTVNHGHAHIISMNPHQQPSHHHHHNQQTQQQLMGSLVGPGVTQTSGNQSTSHIQQQKSQILPLLLSPRPPSLTPNSNDQTEQSENDHEQIIDQVISLENEFSDTSGMLVNVDASSGIMLGHQQRQQQHHLGDINLSGGICIPDSNQFSSSEDLINLLLEFDREPSNLIGLGSNQQLDQDEKAGIETIRKQLMSCEVQSEQHQNTNSMSPIINQQLTCQPQQARTAQQQQHHQQTRDNVHQQKVNQQQLMSQTAPVIPLHQQSHQMSTSGPSPQQQMSADQPMLHGSYSNVSMSNVPVSSSGQSYAPQQQHVTRISQSNPMPIAGSSPSPSWQQPQLSPYSPQPSHNNTRTSSQRQGQQHHAIHPQQQQQQQHSMAQQHQTTTSPQMQQMHHPLQQSSPSQSVSPPVTSEPSPVVKKNPLLNAQLHNTRAPSITSTRFMNSQANVLNQNPILNAKLSQSSYVTNSSANIVGSPVNSSLNQQSRFMQQTQSPTNFNFDITHHQQQNAQQHTPQQSGHMTMYGSSDQQQQSTNQNFRTTPTSTGMNTGGSSLNIGSTSPSGEMSQHAKQEMKRKAQQPKQQQPVTSLLKQLLSDDNK